MLVGVEDMRRKSRILWLIIIIVLSLILLAQIILPGLAENSLRDIFYDRTAKIEELIINVAAFPAFKILRGRLDYIDVNTKGIVIDDLYIDMMSVKYRDVVYGKTGFDGDNTALKAVITQEAINNYIVEQYPDLKNFSININPEQVLFQGYINFFEARINLTLTGNFIINDNDRIYFIPDDLKVEDIKIPVNLLKQYIEKLNFYFDLKELNIPLSIEEIRLSSGQIDIVGGEYIEKGDSE